METRKFQILDLVIKEHIKTGLPVGSGSIVDKYHIEFSPATVRNDMAELEQDGYIMQPHTSAGRVPTEKGYREFLRHIKPKKLARREEEDLSSIFPISDIPRYKLAAKALARLSDSAVFWAFEKHNLYYTGFSHLFSQPEFSRYASALSISQVIDSAEEIISMIFEEPPRDMKILIGSDNPFGKYLSAIIASYENSGRNGIFGLLGPMRMDYEKNLALISYLANAL